MCDLLLNYFSSLYKFDLLHWNLFWLQCYHISEPHSFISDANNFFAELDMVVNTGRIFPQVQCYPLSKSYKHNIFSNLIWIVNIFSVTCLSPDNQQSNISTPDLQHLPFAWMHTFPPWLTSGHQFQVNDCQFGETCSVVTITGCFNHTDALDINNLKSRVKGKSSKIIERWSFFIILNFKSYFLNSRF